MKDGQRHSSNLESRLEREFGNSSQATEAPRRPRTILPILGGSQAYDYDFSPNEYTLARWRRRMSEKHQSPQVRERAEAIRRKYF